MLFDEPYESSTGLSVPHVASRETVPPNVHVHAPHPYGCHVLVHFRSEGRVEIDDRTVWVHGAQCVLLPPGMWWEFSGDSRALGYDRMDLSGPDAAAVVARSTLPLGTVFSPGIFQLVGDLVNTIAMERLTAEEGWDVAIASHAQLLLLHIARSLGHARTERAGGETLDRLRHIRLSIRRHPERHWAVDQMARQAALSRSRFSVVYRSVFGVSPLEDVLQVRLERARHMLSNMELSVSEVADHLGFGSTSYFCRLFRRRVGCAPGAYRSGSRDGHRRGP